MSLRVSDIQSIRKVAIQKIRRAYQKLGMEFHSTPAVFPTAKKNATQAELNTLYNRYENIMAGNFAIPIGDGQFLNPVTGEFYEDEAEVEEAIENAPVIDYIRLARNRLEELPSTSPSYYYALNHFDMIIEKAIENYGRSRLNNWFVEYAQIFDNCYEGIKYSLNKNDESSSYFVDKALQEFEVNLNATI